MDALPVSDAPVIRPRFVALGAFGAGVPVLAALRVSVLWAAIAVAVWLCILGYTWHLLGVTRRSERAPWVRLGVANAVTLFRGWLLALLAGAAVVSAPPMGLVTSLFVLAVSLDAVDGAIARRTHETTLGARLDAAMDALAVLVGSVVAVSVGALPWWYLAAGGVWYAYAGSLSLRKRAGHPVFSLPESRLRPAIGVSQFLIIGVALAPVAVLSVPDVVVAIALGALCVSFARDWAAATGRLGECQERRDR